MVTLQKPKTEKQTRRSSMTSEQTKAIHELKNWDHAYNSKNFAVCNDNTLM